MQNGRCESSVSIRGQLCVLPTSAHSVNHLFNLKKMFSICAYACPTFCQVGVVEESPVCQTFLANANKSAKKIQMRPAQSFPFLHPSASREPCVTLGQEGLMLFFFSCLHNHEDFALVLKRPHSFKPATPPNLGVGGWGGSVVGVARGVPTAFPPSLHPQ